MASIRTLLFVCLFTVTAADVSEAKRLCLMLCPTDSAVAKCTLNWEPTGDCNCKCRGLDWDSVKSQISTSPSLGSSRPGIALGQIDDNTVSLVPTLPEKSSLGLNIVAKEAGPNGGGGEVGKPEKPEKVSPADVERLIRELLVACHLKGGC